MLRYHHPTYTPIRPHHFLLTIVIPIRNHERYIDTLITSILQQNIDKDSYEVLIINDNSHDSTLAKLNAATFKHYRIIDNDVDYGMGFSIRRGCHEAQSKYIAFAHPYDYFPDNSLKKRLDYLEKHADITLLSGWVNEYDKNSTVTIKYSGNKHEILLSKPLSPRASIMRSEFFDMTSITYDIFNRTTYDYQFLIECFMFNHGYPLKIYMEQDVVMHVMAELAIDDDIDRYINNHAPDNLKLYMHMMSILGIDNITIEKMRLHQALQDPDILHIYCNDDLSALTQWAEQVIQNHQQHHIFDDHAVQQFIAYRLANCFAHYRKTSFTLFGTHINFKAVNA